MCEAYFGPISVKEYARTCINWSKECRTLSPAELRIVPKSVAR